MAWEGPSFRPDKFVGNTVAEPGIGTPGRFDHLDLLAIIRVAPDNGTATTERVGVERRCF